MDIRKELESRIIDGFSKSIDCEDGWLSLLERLHNEIVLIDPDYQIYQVKEKLGGLRFYHTSKDKILDGKISKIVNYYEKMSYHICEKTGSQGVLMKRNGWYKTLSPPFQYEGWEIVDQEKKGG